MIAMNASECQDDDELRRTSLAELLRLVRDHTDDVEMFGYHDFSEFPRNLRPIPVAG